MKPLLLAAVLAVTTPASEPVFTFADPEIVESSALVVSRRDPTLAYTVNDSGDLARIFVVDVRSGQTVGETVLVGVENVDFEALAFAPGGRLLVGDIGDNGEERDSIEVHVLPEPGGGVAAVEPRTMSLSYATGARDAEALWVRDGRIFVASKEPFRGVAFRGPLVADLPADAELEPVAEVPGLITDATVLGDGRVVLRNYTHAFVLRAGWQVSHVVELPGARLGESLAAPPRGRWVYAGSEGEQSVVHRVPMPPYSRPQSQSRSPAPSPAPSAVASAGEQSNVPGRPDSVGGAESGAATWPLWAGIVGLMAGAGALLARRLLRHE